MARTSFADAEIAEYYDFDAIGLQAQENTDGIWLDAIGYPAHWAAFTVTRKSAQVVTVETGRFVNGKVVYELKAAKDINLQLHIPLAASDQRWIALLLRGSEVTVVDNRTFETSEDPDTSQPVQRSTPKTIERRVSVIEQAGTANPIPVKPVIAETDACIAFVLLGSAGIISVEPSNSHRVKSLYEVEGRVTAIEIDLDGLFLRTDTIETQIVNIKDKLGDIPRPEIIRQMQRDIGAARLKIDLPDEARAYKFDQGLIPNAWDRAHPNWLARIDEGIRFGFAAQSQARLEVLAEDNPQVVFRGRRMIPAFNEVVRVANTSLDGALNISQLVHTQTTMVRREASRTRITYGPTQWACENQAGWSGLGGDARVGQQFNIGGEVFEVVERRENNGQGHQTYGVRQIRIESYTEAYWDYVTEEIGVNGSIYAQTFLVAQPMIVTSIDLSFSKIGNDGDVHVFIVETTENGAPKFDAVLAKSTLQHASLVVGWNKCTMPFTLLDSGKRFAIVTVTTGAHAVHTSSANKYTGGTMFHTTDGVFAQGSTEVDMCFRVNAARFISPRTVVPMKALNLADGMTQIELLFAGWEPGGTRLGWMIRGNEDVAFTELVDGDPSQSPLNGLPSSVELNMVMMGTADLQPMIQLDDKAVSRVARNRADMTAVSGEVNFGLSTNEIQVQYTLDAFFSEHHSFTPAIQVGTATVTPDATTYVVDPNNPNRRTYTSIFELSSATTSARMRFSAASDTATKIPFVQDVFIAAL